MKFRHTLYRDQILNVKAATSFYARLVGLMGKSNNDNDDGVGLWIYPCNSIHTFFMRYPLDVVFLDSKYRVVKVIYNLRPWKMTWPYFKAVSVLEVRAGALPKNIKVNDLFEVVNV